MRCFAGPDLADLYVTSAREKLDDAALRREPQTGGLFRLRPNIPGQPKAVSDAPRPFGFSLPLPASSTRA
jgi:sugar lactone lactonase YvrE